MFHITIGTIGGELPPTLEPDLRMTKAALLYADKVRLCSSTYSTWISALGKKNMSLEDLIQQTYKLDEMIPYMYHTQADITSALKANRLSRESFQSPNPTVKDVMFYLDNKRLGAKQYEEFKRRFDTLDLDNTQQEFDRAVKAGLLEIHQFREADNDIAASHLRGTFVQSVEKLAEEFNRVVMDAMTDSTTHPLFDDGTGSIVKLGIEVGLISPTATRVAQAKQTQLAANVLNRLPLFDDASMNEILDVRRELEGHLVRFRSAIMKYADMIKIASWDSEFSAEAEEVFHREIEAAVLDIEGAVRTNPSLLELATRKLVGAPALSTSVFSFIVAQLTSLTTITNLAMAASVGLGTAVYDAFKESQKGQRAVEQNQLYFYYRAGELLTNRTYEYRTELR